MLKSSQGNSSQKSSFWSWRPVAVISAFFHPVSTLELKKTLDSAQATLDQADELIKASDKLHEVVDVSLNSHYPKF